MKIFLVLLILTSFGASAQSSFLFDSDEPALEAVPPVRRAKKPKTVVTEDSRSEAAVTCEPCEREKRRLAKIEAAKVAGQTERTARTEEENPVQASGNLEQCLRGQILKSAKYVVKKTYRNQKGSGGNCGRGVGNSLQTAGMSASNSIGDAISFHTGGLLKARGFKNIMTKGMTAANAPPGAVLIFRGPGTNMNRADGGLPRRSKRKGKSAGNWVGHITIKGDKPNRYYTDGWTSAPAIARRTLVAIYVPETCNKLCRKKNRNACGAYF